jgi:hypothetical protein
MDINEPPLMDVAHVAMPYLADVISTTSVASLKLVILL